MSSSLRQLAQTSSSGHSQPALSIDGVLRTASQPNMAVTEKRQPAVAAYRRQFQLPQQGRPKLLVRIWNRIRLPSLLIGGIAAGLLLQQAWFGIAAITLYGILSFVLHVPSRTTFALATVALGAVCAILLAGSNREVAHSFATYTFLLLVLGVIALSFEAKPQRRRKRQNGR
jgi:hypothetical protein